MDTNFIHAAYNQWIELNQSRFKYPPYIIKSEADYFTLGFTGLTKCLTCSIQEWGQFELFIHDDQGTYWDIVRDFDLQEKLTDDGLYYCGFCEEKTYYSTRQALWEGLALNLYWLGSTALRQTLMFACMASPKKVCGERGY